MRDDAESPSNDTIDIEAEVMQEEVPAFGSAIAEALSDAPEPYSPERAAAKERIRLAFITGKATLAYMARTEKISYSTIMQWSSAEEWGKAREKTIEAASSKTEENIVEWMAKERTAQIKRSLSRAGNIRSLVDEAAENARRSESGLLPSDVQALSTAEERADNITRRNLGMDQQSGGGNSLSVNILTNSITLS